MSEPVSALPDSSSPADAQPSGVRVVIVTGLSGAGKTQALKALEDSGYEAVDNLPLSLMEKLLRSVPDGRPLALGIDIRTRDFAAGPMLEEVRRMQQGSSVSVSLVFLDCDDDVLCRRFTETRRRHPLAADRPLRDGIAHERRLLAPLRGQADLLLDTSTMPPGELRRLIASRFALEGGRSMVVFVMSFSYRQGLPREADLVFDCRFLRNPHYEPALRPLTGADPDVAAYVAADPDFPRFFTGLTELTGLLLPRFTAEGKSYLTLAVGCTGGRHRSVMVAERLSRFLRDSGQSVELRHRELEKDSGK